MAREVQVAQVPDLEDYISEADLESASASLEGQWSAHLVEGGQPQAEAQTEAAKIVTKLEPLLALRLQRPPLQEEVPGVPPTRPKLRVLIYYKPKPEKDFDSIVDALAKELGRARGESTEATGGALELTPEERTEAVGVLESAADVSAEGLIGQLEREGGEVVEHLRLPGAVVARLSAEQIRELAKRDDVERVEIDKPIIAELKQSAVTVKLNDARSQGLVAGGRGVIVALLDGEVNGRHPDLQGRVIAKRNYTQEAWGRPSRHGTHVAGIIAGAGPEYRGMAPEATIWNYKLFPTGGAEGVESAQLESQEGSTGADAIEDAVKDGAKVINCSWGIGGAALNGSSAWALAAERATKLGVVLVKSAGNSGPDAGTLTTPADARGDVIVVGAADRAGTGVTSFSSRGPTADGRNKPDICAPGERIMSASDAGTGYRALSGTSMAAPHVSGLAALLVERNPTWKAANVKKALMDTADPLSAADNSPDVQGKGLVNLVKAVGATETQPTDTSGAASDGAEAVSLAKALKPVRDDLAALRREVGEVKRDVAEIKAASGRRR
jgi:subtilisin family serine protease